LRIVKLLNPECFLWITWHFFKRMMAQCTARVAGGEATHLALVIALTSYWFFAFFGGDGTEGSYGLVSPLLAIGSKYFLFRSLSYTSQQGIGSPQKPSTAGKRHRMRTFH
jgi:hypothetical protein